MVKCMNLSFWMEFSEEDFNDPDFTCCYEKEIEPIFSRDGWYLDGNKCWFEYKDRAFLVSKIDFLYTLEVMNYLERPLRKKEFEALLVLENTKLITKKQKELLFFERSRIDSLRAKLEFLDFYKD